MSQEKKKKTPLSWREWSVFMRQNWCSKSITLWTKMQKQEWQTILFFFPFLCKEWQTIQAEGLLCKNRDRTDADESEDRLQSQSGTGLFCFNGWLVSLISQIPKVGLKHSEKRESYTNVWFCRVLKSRRIAVTQQEITLEFGFSGRVCATETVKTFGCFSSHVLERSYDIKLFEELEKHISIIASGSTLQRGWVMLRQAVVTSKKKSEMVTEGQKTKKTLEMMG